MARARFFNASPSSLFFHPPYSNKIANPRRRMDGGSVTGGMVKLVAVLHARITLVDNAVRT
jgi:hypothetical protein